MRMPETTGRKWSEAMDLPHPSYDDLCYICIVQLHKDAFLCDVKTSLFPFGQIGLVDVRVREKSETLRLLRLRFNKIWRAAP